MLYTQQRDTASPRNVIVLMNMASASLAILTLLTFCNKVWFWGWLVRVLPQIGTEYTYTATMLESV